MPRTSSPIFTNKQSSTPTVPKQHLVDTNKLSTEIVKRIENKRTEKSKPKSLRARKTALELLAAKIAAKLAKRFVLTPLAFRYFGFITNMYNKTGGFSKLAVSSPYYKLAGMLVNRLLSITLKLLISLIQEINKGKNKLSLRILNLKLKLALKVNNFDSFVSFLSSSPLWDDLKKSLPFKAGVKLLYKLQRLSNPRSQQDIVDIIRTVSAITKWSNTIKTNKAKRAKKLIIKYSNMLNKGLKSSTKSVEKFKI